MWIKTQNNRELINVCDVKILKSGKKAYLMAVIKGAGLMSSGNKIIAKYKTMDEAEIALDKIEISIANKEQIHIMSTQ
ncbi:MAG: hypothetical protein COB98_01545 [Flavobacteriaceae bacterium]|nr:MAG: hypothetical protein COB98_01545 [Flavobacteriaceae bacterium]